MNWVKKWESFSTDIEIGPGIPELKFHGPYAYDRHKLRGKNKVVWRIEAKRGDEVIGSSNYFDPDPNSTAWDSYLLGVVEEFRKDPEYKNLGVILRLLTFGILERKTGISQDLSESGLGFVKKWERLGVWKNEGMSQTLTQFGIKQSEKLCMEILGIQKINWK